jgi:adenylate kinase
MQIMSLIGRRELMMTVGLLFPLLVAAQETQAKRVILLVGAPGAGKSTQAKKLSKRLDIPAISMSDILRKEGGGKSDLNKRLKAQIASGELVSDEIANALVRKRITQKDAERGFILDGYPRTAAQADYLHATLADLGLPTPIVVSIAVPEQVALERMETRRRADDKPEIMKRRLDEHKQQADFVLERYKGLVKTVDGSGSPDQVAKQIEQAVDQR